MKKTLVLIAALTLSIGMSSPSQAVPWDWDLSGVGAAGVTADVDGTVWEGVNYLEFMNISNGGTTPDANVTQSLGGDGILNNGDSFSEYGFMREIAVDGAPVTFRDNATDTSLRGYFKFDDLEGAITNYNNGGDGDTTLANYETTIINDTFDLIFTPGAGTIDFWLDDDFDPTNGSYDVKLASFSLLGANGIAPELTVTGTANGTFNFVLGFTEVMEGVWSLPGLGDMLFEDFMDQYGIPSIFGLSEMDATLTGLPADDGENILFTIENDGKFSIAVVPEPSTLMLLGAGLIGAAAFGRKRMKK